MGKVILGLGILGVVLGGLVTVGSLLLPDITRNVSRDESLIGVIAGIVIIAVSFLPILIGVVLMIVNRKKLKA